MTFEEFEKASPRELQQAAKTFFNAADEHGVGWIGAAASLLQSQFYMAEIARRENNNDSRKSHRMERIIIWLIVFELLLAAVALWLDVQGGREEIRALSRIEHAIAARQKP